MLHHTVGVEQEFLLVDPDSRRPVALAPLVGDLSCAPGVWSRWDVRPSADHPTVEVRVADIPRPAREVSVLAEPIQALVVTEPSEGRVDDSVPRAAYWRASRDGADGLAADPHTGKLSPASDRAVSLVEHVAVALRDRGTLSTVEHQLDWLRHNGRGAARQRRRPDPESLVDLLIARTREET